jgi:hypothetical protein
MGFQCGICGDHSFSLDNVETGREGPLMGNLESKQM